MVVPRPVETPDISGDDPGPKMLQPTTAAPTTIFAELPVRSVTWAVGAIHGDATRLATLHERLADHLGPSDNLVYLGNFLGRGSRVGDTVDELLLFRRAAYTEDGSLLFVNAGIDPSRPLSQQSDSFWWGGQDFDGIDGDYGGFRRVVRGFDRRQRGVVIKELTASIDGGCGFGGPLVAVGFDPQGQIAEIIES